MPNKLRQRTRSLFSRFRPVEHIPDVSHNNVHDLSRIGGVSVLSLPREHTPCDLVIPTRFAALAQFLVDAGVETGPPFSDDSAWDERGETKWVEERGVERVHIPGLFRIPGSKVTTDRLKSYFERQMYDGGGTVEDAKRRSVDIEFTVRLPLLPNANVIPYQIHDVASCFKSFLADLDGGILGSLDIFEGLRKVVLPQRPRKSTHSADLEWKCRGAPSEHESVDPKHIASILCSIECAASRNLIMAVFGLLAFFMVDDSPEQPYEQRMDSGVPGLKEMQENCFAMGNGDTRMTAEALGRIFAPLMLSEHAVKDIKMDFGKPVAEKKNKERRRESWTPSPLKKTNIARLRPRSATGASKVNVHINICHPHPLRSSPYLPLHEAAHNSTYDITSPPPSRSEHVSRVYGAHLLDTNNPHDSANSFLRDHANRSAPNLTNITNIRRTSPRKAPTTNQRP